MDFITEEQVYRTLVVTHGGGRADGHSSLTGLAGTTLSYRQLGQVLEQDPDRLLHVVGALHADQDLGLGQKHRQGGKQLRLTKAGSSIDHSAPPLLVSRLDDLERLFLLGPELERSQVVPVPVELLGKPGRVIDVANLVAQTSKYLRAPGRSSQPES